ncbi:DUF6417 family protein [Streptomyces sp. NPDC054950]
MDEVRTACCDHRVNRWVLHLTDDQIASVAYVFWLHKTTGVSGELKWLRPAPPEQHRCPAHRPGRPPPRATAHRMAHRVAGRRSPAPPQRPRPGEHLRRHPRQHSHPPEPALIRSLRLVPAPPRARPGEDRTDRPAASPRARRRTWRRRVLAVHRPLEERSYAFPVPRRRIGRPRPQRPGLRYPQRPARLPGEVPSADHSRWRS